MYGVERGTTGLAYLSKKWKVENCCTSPSPTGEGAAVRELCERYGCG